jgi:hypothetical protein
LDGPFHNVDDIAESGNPESDEPVREAADAADALAGERMSVGTPAAPRPAR